MKSRILASALVLTLLTASVQPVAADTNFDCEMRIRILKSQGQDPLAEIRSLKATKENPPRYVREGVGDGIPAGFIGGLVLCAAIHRCDLGNGIYLALAAAAAGGAVGAYSGSRKEDRHNREVDQELACLKSRFGEAVSSTSLKSTMVQSAKDEGLIIGAKSGFDMNGSTTQQAK